MVVSIIVPSYGRPAELSSCLDDLGAQDFEGPYEILLVCRPDDLQTRDVAGQLRPVAANCSLRCVTVNQPGIVTALRAGFESSSSEFIAFCDDDARYDVDWVSRLLALFGDDGVGGVGGRIAELDTAARAVRPRDVAQVSWSGRAKYNVRGEPRFDSPCEVHMLPGANMCFRRKALSAEDFDVSLDAPGLSPGMELSISWQVRRRGFRIMFDPTLVVHHFPAPWAEGQRGRNEARTWAYSRNICYIMLSNLRPLPRVVFLLRSYLIGERESPGIGVWLFLVSLRRSPHSRWFRQSMHAKNAGRRLARHAAHESDRRRRRPSTAGVAIATHAAPVSEAGQRERGPVL